MNHLNGHPHAFIKNGRVIDIHVFDESAHDSDTLNSAQTTLGADTTVCLCNYTSSGVEKPDVHHTWDGTSFTRPTLEDLVALGVANTPIPGLSGTTTYVTYSSDYAESPDNAVEEIPGAVAIQGTVKLADVLQGVQGTQGVQQS